MAPSNELLIPPYPLCLSGGRSNRGFSLANATIKLVLEPSGLAPGKMYATCVLSAPDQSDFIMTEHILEDDDSELAVALEELAEDGERVERIKDLYCEQRANCRGRVFGPSGKAECGTFGKLATRAVLTLAVQDDC